MQYVTFCKAAAKVLQCCFTASLLSQVSDDEHDFVIVHNGTITNYKELKNFLTKEGFVFYSETDTEVIAKLCKYVYDAYQERGSPEPESPSTELRTTLQSVHLLAMSEKPIVDFATVRLLANMLT